MEYSGETVRRRYLGQWLDLALRSRCRAVSLVNFSWRFVPRAGLSEIPARDTGRPICLDMVWSPWVGLRHRLVTIDCNQRNQRWRAWMRRFGSGTHTGSQSQGCSGPCRRAGSAADESLATLWLRVGGCGNKNAPRAKAQRGAPMQP